MWSPSRLGWCLPGGSAELSLFPSPRVFPPPSVSENSPMTFPPIFSPGSAPLPPPRLMSFCFTHCEGVFVALPNRGLPNTPLNTHNNTPNSPRKARKVWHLRSHSHPSRHGVQPLRHEAPETNSSSTASGGSPLAAATCRAVPPQGRLLPSGTLNPKGPVEAQPAPPPERSTAEQRAVDGLLLHVASCRRGGSHRAWGCWGLQEASSGSPETVASETDQGKTQNDIPGTEELQSQTHEHGTGGAERWESD